MKTIYFSYILLWFCYSCGSDVAPSNSGDPGNLTVTITQDESTPEKISITATADNTVEFYYDTGDGSGDPHISSLGSYEYTYSSGGSYVVEVRAYGASGRFISANRNVLVITKDPVTTEDGYTTPLSYDGMELVWNDEFNGSVLNEGNWSYDLGTGCPNLCGWGNNELEYYRAENCWVGDGVLTLEARRESFQGQAYTSGKIVTRDKQAFQYGRIDIRAVLPKGQGIWPALWMLGTNQRTVGWPKCGEIDIMEMVGGGGKEKTISGNAFWDNDGVADMPKGYSLGEGLFSDEFHVFSIIWDEQKITWYVDDNAYHSLDITTEERQEFHNPFYIICNVAVGGNWPGSPDNSTVFPTKMMVDYIRVFQKK